MTRQIDRRVTLALGICLGPRKMTLRIRLPRGTLKVKTYRELRTREHDRRVPIMKVGSLYFIWWSNQQSNSPQKPDR
ncbi:hypothetical protein [Mesorhizobium sp. M1163]|uniref:hypothetical protein n=1 Tax=Mesorhizobium sp. M1163 TaxID=2957065 RepID=UPI003336235E